MKPNKCFSLKIPQNAVIVCIGICLLLLFFFSWKAILAIGGLGLIVAGCWGAKRC